MENASTFACEKPRGRLLTLPLAIVARTSAPRLPLVVYEVCIEPIGREIRRIGNFNRDNP